MTLLSLKAVTLVNKNIANTLTLPQLKHPKGTSFGRSGILGNSRLLTGVYSKLKRFAQPQVHEALLARCSWMH
ncbi:hypothetical protein SAMN05444487_1391 [Marininema mesophilum]|uniref:Uncharacterized protein n=1 Tax=Marininema mesophilum TaxID=1048340 RepID=A0A1H3D3R7_9BACL|nr:hypothetical protein SAMN05444487_1391 [Marininema mesophilum]